MNFSLLAERTRYLKENLEGVEMMCKSIEAMRNEAAERAAKKAAKEATENTLLQSIKNLMETMKWTAEQTMDALKISDTDKIRYMEKL